MIYLVSNQLNAFENKFRQITIEESLNLLYNLSNIGLDTETEGLDCFQNKLLTLQLGNSDIQIVYDIASFSGIIPQQVKDFLNKNDKLYIIQNAKFDLKFLYRQDVYIKNVYDTMLAEFILTNGLQISGRDLATLCHKYCDVTLDKSIRGEIITKGLNHAVIQYAAYDVVYLEDIMNKQMRNIKGGNLQNALKLDNEFVKILAYMEFCGIKLNWEKWRVKSERDILKVIEKRDLLNQWLLDNGHLEYFDGMLDMFTNEMKCILNWNSSTQVIKLFEKLGINCEIVDKGVKKKTIEEKAIGKYRKDFPILNLYFEYKEVVKMSSTYGLNWKKMINPITGRIHTNYNQLMNTGRLSSGNAKENKPNLQNLPSDEFTRSCFIAEPGNKFIAADYSSQEQIVLANFSLEKNLINFYEKGFSDMHSYVAFLMYPEIRRCTIEELEPDKLNYIKKEYPDKRSLAKSAGFAINYGGNGATIAKNCNISKTDGEFVYNNYFKAFPGLKNYFELVLAKAEHFDYILFNNITGRKLFISLDEPFIKYKNIIKSPEFWYDPEAKNIMREYNKSKSEIQRKAQNYPIQGSSADISKLSGIIFYNQLIEKNLLGKVKMVNMVHDEWCIEAPEEIASEISDLLVKCMKAAGDQFCKIVKLGAVAEIGDYWIH